MTRSGSAPAELRARGALAGTGYGVTPISTSGTAIRVATSGAAASGVASGTASVGSGAATGVAR